jgi:transglutaminase-like putative cysteine protease
MKAMTRIALAAATVTMALGCSTTHGEERRFEVTNEYRIEVPAGAHEVRAWLALPDDHDGAQTVGKLKTAMQGPIGAELEVREIRDALGNRMLYLTSQGKAGTLVLTTSFELARREVRGGTEPDDTRPLTAKEQAKLAPYLAEHEHVVATPAIEQAARDVVGDEQNPVRQARLLYDWVLGRTQYWVKFPATMKASGLGSSTYCYEKCTGNCTDFHSLYVAAARAVGLPARLIYGSFLKQPLDGVDKDQSYHCWVEFWAPKLGWIPLDVAVADVFVDDFALDDANRSLVDLTVAAGYHGPDPTLVEYYFGNLEARRVTWHQGRDLVPEVAPNAGRISALPKAHVEVDGTPLAEGKGWTRKLTFRELH